MLMLSGLCLCHSQGFINLDFEQAQIPINPGLGVSVSAAIPGWTAYVGGVPQTDIFYNTMSLGAAAIDLEPTNGIAPVPQIQGNYYVDIQGSAFTTPATAAIGQTGQVPLNALYLLFWGYAGDPSVSAVSFAGDFLALTQIGSAVNYDIYAADISSYAGQTGQLLFSGLANGGIIVDNIQFSSTPIPEPSVLGLSALGGLFLACRRWKFFRYDKR